MPVDTYSAWRAWTASGFGNGPGESLPGGGNQYLYADPEIWNEADTPVDLRKWLTPVPKGAYQLGWAAFSPNPRWHFVACIEGAERGNIFAHARGWRAADWQDTEFDPGVWLGDRLAFSPPCKNAEELLSVQPNFPAERAAAWKDLVARRRDTVALVLAHLYHAVESSGSVIWQVPQSEFREGSDVVEIVAAVRAALPWETKRRAGIRVNTGDPRAFLAAPLNAHLVVLGDDHEPPHEAAVVLGADGVAVRGDAPPPPRVVFGRAVADRMMADSKSVLRFSATAHSRLEHIQDDARALGVAVPIVYRVAVAWSRRGQIDDMLLQLMKASQKRRRTVMQWRRLISEVEWSSVDRQTLQELALARARTEDSRALREVARTFLSQRKLKLDGAIADWWRPDMQHAGDVLCLLNAPRLPNGDHLLSAAMAGPCLRTLSAARAAKILAHAELGAEFARQVGAVPDAWYSPRLLRPSSPIRCFLAVARTMSAIAPWRRWLDSWAQQLAAAPELPPELELVLKNMGPPDKAAGLPVILAYGEIYCRLPGTGLEGDMSSRLLNGGWSAEERRDLIGQCIEGKSQFLRRHLPTSWILQEWEARFFESYVAVLDARLQGTSQIREMGFLIQSGKWLAWRRQSLLNQEELAGCALNWLLTSQSEPPLDEWNQVMQDLKGRLTGAWMRRVNKSRGNCLPWIKDKRPEQLRDLLEASADLSADGEIALAGPDPAGIREIENLSPRMQGMPEGTIDWLMDQSRPKPPEFTFEQVCRLVETAGDRRPLALFQYVRVYVRELAGGNLTAKRDVRDRELWADTDFRQKVAVWVKAKGASLANDPRGRALNEAVEFGPDSPIPGTDLRELAQLMLRCRYQRIARFLVPDMIGETSIQNAARQLSEGITNSAEWRDIVSRCSLATTSPNHPLSELAEALDYLADEEKDQLAAFGRDAFVRLLDQNYQMLRGRLPFEGGLPAFMVLAKLAPSVSLGELACDLLRMKYGKDAGAESDPEWTAALVRAVLTARRLPGKELASDDRDAALGRLFRVADCSMGRYSSVGRESFASLLDQVAPENAWSAYRGAHRVRQEAT